MPKLWTTEESLAMMIFIVKSTNPKVDYKMLAAHLSTPENPRTPKAVLLQYQKLKSAGKEVSSTEQPDFNGDVEAQFTSDEAAKTPGKRKVGKKSSIEKEGNGGKFKKTKSSTEIKEEEMLV